MKKRIHESEFVQTVAKLGDERSNIDVFFEITRIENKYAIASLISELTRKIRRGIEKCGKRNVYVYD